MAGKVKLTLDGLDTEVLRAAKLMSCMGGTMPLYYAEYRRREKLRKRGLLKFWNQRSPNWRLCCYGITDAGRAHLASSGKDD